MLDSDDSIARCEEYYLYKFKEKILILCKEYHDFCIDEWDTDEERGIYCKRCEVHSFMKRYLVCRKIKFEISYTLSILIF